MKKYLFILSLLTIIISCSQVPKYPTKLPKVVDELSDTVLGLTVKISYFDDEQMTYKVSCYDKNNELVIGPHFGASEEIALEDKKGIVKVLFFDDKHNLMTNILTGYSSRELRYDDNKNLVKESYYNLGGELVVPWNNERFLYDFASNFIRESNYYSYSVIPYLDLNFAERSFEYNENGQITTIKIFNTKQEIILPIVSLTYDNLGNCTKLEYINGNGDLMLNEKGIAYLLKNYTESGDIIELSFHGLNGELVMSDDVNAARIEYINTDFGTKEQRFDTSNSPLNIVLGSDCELDEQRVNMDTFSDENRVKNIIKFL